MTPVRLPIELAPPPGVWATHWVIYKHPKDHPEHYVLRASHITDANNIMPDRMAWRHKDVEVLRSILPPGLVKLDRHPDDAPAILEVWL
jgi:hypothetical protein